MCEQIMCQASRDVRPTGQGMCRAEAPARDITLRRPRSDIWRYPWNGSDCVIINFDGMRFEFRRYNNRFTSRNLRGLIQHFEMRVQDEREQRIRGSGTLRALADFMSGTQLPNRDGHFVQMNRAVSDARRAATANNLGGTIRSLRGGLTYLNVARHIWRDYLQENLEGAETNVAIVRATRDISLSVSTTVLTGGASLGTTVGVAVGTAAVTTGLEEVLVTDFGRSGVINLERIGMDMATAVFAELGGKLASDMGKVVLKKLGPLLRECDMIGAFESTIVSRFPNMSPQQRNELVEQLGRQARSGSAGDISWTRLGIDFNAMRSIAISVISDTFHRMPRNIINSILQPILQEVGNLATGRDTMSSDEFCDKVISEIISSHTSVSRTIVTAMLASLQP